jgi:hypothetical protein
MPRRVRLAAALFGSRLCLAKASPDPENHPSSTKQYQRNNHRAREVGLDAFLRFLPILQPFKSGRWRREPGVKAEGHVEYICDRMKTSHKIVTPTHSRKAPRTQFMARPPSCASSYTECRQHQGRRSGPHDHERVRHGCPRCDRYSIPRATAAPNTAQPGGTNGSMSNNHGAEAGGSLSVRHGIDEEPEDRPQRRPNGCRDRNSSLHRGAGGAACQVVSKRPARTAQPPRRTS